MSLLQEPFLHFPCFHFSPFPGQQQVPALRSRCTELCGSGRNICSSFRAQHVWSVAGGRLWSADTLRTALPLLSHSWLPGEQSQQQDREGTR